MIKGTTPTFTFTIRSDTLDLTEAENVYVSLAQGTKEFVKSGDDLEVGARTVSVFLAQEESLQFYEGSNMDVQVNWTYLDASNTVRRAATKVKSIPVTKQLLKRVIE